MTIATGIDGWPTDGEVRPMVIGGAEFYRQVLPRADTLYLTRVHADFEGDTFFPEPDASEWREVEHRDCEPDDKNPYRYSFIRLDRINPRPRS